MQVPPRERSSYPAIGLEGTYNKDNTLIAKVFYDRMSRRKHLAVRSLASPLVMVVPHDGVDEFLWAPSGESLVFTASTTDNYHGSIFSWNLRTGEIRDLLTGPSLKAAVTGRASTKSRRWLTLLGWSEDRLVALVMPRIGDTLDPLEFFAPSNRLIIELGKKPKAELAPDSERKKLSRFTFTLGEAISPGKRARRVQRRWLEMPTSGQNDALLETWQTYCEQYATGSIFPYGLWYLSVLYAQVVAEGGLSERERATLLAFSREVAKALADFLPAPPYLRGMAHHHLISMPDSGRIPYRVLGRRALID